MFTLIPTYLHVALALSIGLPMGIAMVRSSFEQ